jgi:hypothetical protein
MDFDARYQEAKNGCLTRDLRERIKRFRSFLTLADIGKELSFSGPFISQILNEKTPARVDSKHIPRIVNAVNDMEGRYAKKLVPSEAERVTNGHASVSVGTLDYHLRAIDALGWKIMGIAPK